MNDYSFISAPQLKRDPLDGSNVLRLGTDTSMGIVPPEELWPRLEEMGEDQVKQRIAQGAFGPRKLPTVQAWLEKKDHDRRLAINSAEQREAQRGVDAAEGTRSATWVIAWATIALVAVAAATLLLAR